MSISACPDTSSPTGPRAPQDVALLQAVVAVQGGDLGRFEEIYRTCFGRVYALARALLRDDDGAEDVAQETFLAALRALPRYRPQPDVPFVAWLLRIARNAALMRVRTSGRIAPFEHATLEGLLDSSGAVAAPALLDEVGLAAAVATLPPRQRAVLLLRFGFDLSAADVALVMDATPDGVRQLQRRALCALRRALGAADTAHGVRVSEGGVTFVGAGALS